MVRRIARNAGIGHLHPHRLEAVAAMLGHKNLEMTFAYARIADGTVADEYFDVTTRVDQIYGRHLPANLEGPNMRHLLQQHRRMLGNGWCDRPADMDCHYETICETCTFYTTDTTHTRVDSGSVGTVRSPV